MERAGRGPSWPLPCPVLGAAAATDGGSTAWRHGRAGSGSREAGSRVEGNGSCGACSAGWGEPCIPAIRAAAGCRLARPGQQAGAEFGPGRGAAAASAAPAPCGVQLSTRDGWLLRKRRGWAWEPEPFWLPWGRAGGGRRCTPQFCVLESASHRHGLGAVGLGLVVSRPGAEQPIQPPAGGPSTSLVLHRMWWAP